MAGAGYIIKTGVTFDTKSAERQITKLAKIVNEFKAKQAEIQRQLSDAEKRGDKDAEKMYEKELNRIRGLEKTAKGQLKNAVDSTNRIKESMKGLTGMSLQELKNTERAVMSEMNKLMVSGNEGNKKWANQLARHLRNIKLEMENMRAGFPDLQKQMENFGGKSVSYLKDLYGRLRANREAMSETTTGGFNQTMYEHIGKQMAKINDQIKIMEGGWHNVRTSSTTSLEEQKRHWQDMISNAEKGSKELKTYQANLEKVIKEEERRQKLEAKKTVKKVETGKFSATIKETQEAIEQLKKYRETLKPVTTKQTVFDEVDRAILRLETDLKVSENGFRSITEVMKMAGKVGSGEFKGTLMDLKNMKVALEEYRKSISVTDTGQLQTVDNLLKDIEIATKNSGMSQKELNKVIASPKTASYNQLKAAAEKLTFELKNMTAGQAEYNKKAEQLRSVNMQVQEISKSWKEQTSTLANAFSRLKSYVMIYMGFQQVLAKTREFISGNLELSDQMTNVQKVTNMANDEIITLTQNLQALDTRTTTTELMQFAEQAGKLGIYTEHGVKGMQEFVQMAERINATLGEDIGGAEAVASLAKVADIMGETAKLGGSVATALDAVGSSILSVGNQSAASYSSVVNYTGRLGAIGAACQMSITDIIALGAELDALKMPAEAGSTAMAQFISALSNNVEAMAKAAGVSVVELRKQVEGYVDDLGNVVAPDMMGALKTVLNAVSRGAASAQDLMNAMTGRSRTNVNIRSTLQLLSSHLEDLDKQLGYAREGYESATKSVREYQMSAVEMINTQSRMSVMSQEFARVNENAAGIMKRLGNSIRETFINSGAVNAFKSILSRFASFIEYLRDSSVGASAMRTALIALSAAAMAATSTFQKLIAEMLTFSKTALLGAISNLEKFSLSLDKHGLKPLVRMRMAWMSLSNFIKTNPIIFATAAFAAAISAINSLKKSMDEAKKAHQLYNEEVEKEITKANILFTRLRNENESREEKLRLIKEINSSYGKYIGFMLSEANNTRELASAHALLIDKLREEALVKKQNSVVEDAVNRHGGKVTDLTLELSERLNKSQAFKGKGDEIAGIVQSKISEFISQGIANEDVIQDAVIKALSRQGFNSPGFKERKVGSGGLIRDLIKEYLKINSETKTILTTTQAELKSVQKIKKNDAVKVANDLAKQIGEMQKSGIANSELGAYVEKLQQYINTIRDNGVESEQAKKNVATYTKELIKYRAIAKKYNQKGIREAIWGKDGDTIETMMSETLKSMIERWDAIENDINNDIDITQTFPELIGKVDGMNAEQIRNYLRNEASRARDELLRRGDNIKANFRWDENGSGKGLKDQLRDEMNAYIKQLDEFYERRKELIEEARAREEITEEEMNRRIEANEDEHLKARIKLRNGYLHRDNQLTEEEMNVLNEYFRNLDPDNIMFTKKGINDLGTKLAQTFGIGFVQEISLAAQKDGTKIQEIILDRKKKIEEALLEGDSIGKVLNDFFKMTDTLGIFFKNASDFTQKEVDKRLDILRGYTAKVNAMTLKEFSDEIHAQEEFAALSEDETKIMYEKLLQLREDYDSAVRKQAQKDIKLGDNRYRNGTWYKEQLDIYNSYLNRLTEAGQTETDIYRNVVETISYLRKRQNRDGKSWVEEQEKQLASLEKNLEREKKVGASGVANDTNIAKAEIAIVEHQMNMELEKLTYRRSLYAGEIQAIENTKSQLQEDLKILDEDSYEYIEKKRMLDVVNADLLAKQVARDEAVKESEKSVLDLQKEVTEKQADLLAKRMNDVQEWMSIFTDTINSIGKAGASAAESKRFEIMQKNQEELINGAAYVGSTYLETASDGMLKAVKRYTEKTTYLIMKASGDIKTVSLSAVEAMQEEIRIAASNERIEAFNNMFQAFGEKLSKAVTDKFTRDAELEEQKNFEQQRQQVIQDAQLASLNIQLAAEQNYTLQYQQELAKRFDMQADYYRKSQQIQQNAHSGTGNVSVGIQGPGVSLSGDTTKAIVESWGKAGEAMVEISNKTTDAMVKSDEQKVKSAETSTASMIQSANLYSAAYNTLTNDALNSTQKAQMFIIQAVGQTLTTLLSSAISMAVGNSALSLGEAISKCFGQLGVGGFAAVAGITAAIGAAMAMATNSAKKSMQQISAITNTGSGSGSSRRLVTGMLTYAEGNYPVLGNDGKVYNAKYEKKLSTGIYSGPRFGIFSEKRPEAVIDGETTQKLLLDYPAIWKSILTISKNGRLVNGGGGAMATHAAGTLEEVTRAYTQANPQLQAMPQQDNSELTATLQALMQVLTSGEIKTSIDMYGQGGLRSQSQRAERFAQRRRIP